MENRNPVISVIMPFFNSENTLERAADSISKQTFPGFECILVDNNSSDGSYEIAEKICIDDKRFRLVREEQQGVVFAFNKGLELAKGSFIARMDSDDYSYPGRLELQHNFLEQNPGYGAVSGLVKYISHTEETKGFSRYVDWVNSLKTWDEIYTGRFIELPVINPSTMWRKDISDKYGTYRKGKFPEDYEMWLRWFCNGVKTGKISEYVLEWYDSDTRLSRTDPVYSEEAFYRIKSFYLSHWLEKNNPQHLKIVVWGASRICRKRATCLKRFGIDIDYFIDTKRTRRLDQKIVYYEDIPAPGKIFILAYMKRPGTRRAIREFLDSRGYVEGKNYLMMS